MAGLVRVLRRWQGVVLSLVGLAATLWLAATGRLGLYIHPRYFFFTTVLAVVAAVLIVAAVAVTRSGSGLVHVDDGDDQHEHEHGDPIEASGGVRRGRAVWHSAALVVGSASIVVAAIGGLLVIPPSTLTSATADAREMNTGAIESSRPEGEYADYSVKDWAALLSQGEPQQFFAGRSATVSGFVTPDADDPENVFYVARFVVTCCAVDAQPVGVPIHRPGWQQDYEIDSWLEVSGGFVGNPSVTSAASIVLEPETITPIEEPAMPYVY